MRTRLPLWSIPVLSLILVLGCAQPEPEPPADTETSAAFSTNTDPEVLDKPFSDQIFVLVSVVGGEFKVLPERVVVHNPNQEVIWIAEDPDVAMEITFRPDKGNDRPRGARPPGKPCPAQARKCGGALVIGDRGKFHYSVTGTKAGQALPELDPVLDILP